MNNEEKNNWYRQNRKEISEKANQAIQRLQTLESMHSVNSEDEDFFKFVTTCCSKEIAEPVVPKEGYKVQGTCPRCHHDVQAYVGHCNCCGQRLDWSGYLE